MKTKQQLIKEVNEFLKEVNELQAKIDSMPDVPVGKTGVIYEAPESGTEIWRLSSNDTVLALKYYPIWFKELAQGILFHDEESAIHAVKVRAIRHKLAGFCAKAWNDAGEVVDWDNDQQRKQHLVYDYEDSIVLPTVSYRLKRSDYHLPCSDLTELKASFTQDELKLALTGEV